MSSQKSFVSANFNLALAYVQEPDRIFLKLPWKSARDLELADQSIIAFIGFFSRHVSFPDCLRLHESHTLSSTEAVVCCAAQLVSFTHLLILVCFFFQRIRRLCIFSASLLFAYCFRNRGETQSFGVVPTIFQHSSVKFSLFFFCSKALLHVS